VDNLEKYTFEFLLNKALAEVSTHIDTREGSIIYDALAPACMALAEAFLNLKMFRDAVFIQTSFEQYLNLKVADQGLTRRLATRAIKLGTFTDSEGNPFNGLVGARFSTIHPTNTLIYTALSPHSADGTYQLECEEYGTIGNDYIGELLPVTHINGLGTAEMSTLLIPAQNDETDDNLRARFMAAVNVSAFGGNVTQYREELLAIDGIGAVQIYSVWDGGGTVKASIISGDYNAVSDEFIENVQNLVDPKQDGKGDGFAPIGHVVTITTPVEKVINVDVEIVLIGDITVGQIRLAINEAIGNYFASLQAGWGRSSENNQYSLTIFRSQISAALLAIPEIINVSNILLNNGYSDIVLTQSGTLQELPLLGEVIVNGY